MSGLFGSLAKTPATVPAAAHGVNLNTSVYGKPLPLVYGVTRVGTNLLEYGNFNTSQQNASGSGGGKGGLFGSPATGQQGYVYFADFAVALCEGPIQGIGTVWKNNNQHQLSDPHFNFSLFTGTFPQTAWANALTWQYVNASGSTVQGSLTTQLGYNGIAYVASNHFPLGNSASIPNFQFEVQGLLSTSFSGSTTNLTDADPSAVLTDVLTNANHGMSTRFAPKLGSLTSYQNYCFATGLVVSPYYDVQRTAADIVDELALATNSAPVWTGGQFTLIPYGDTALTANGKTYTPPSVQYSLTDNDFIKSPQGGGNLSGGASGPVVLERKRASDKTNQIKIEFLDRANQYAPGIAYANDQGLIDAYGLRSNGSKQLHLFCSSSAANLSAHLQLRRLARISNTYYFDLDQRYILLDPMDLVQLTDSYLGLNAQTVQIKQIQENDDGTLSFVADEYLGTQGQPIYNFGAGAGFAQNPGAAAVAVNTPIIFEPTKQLLEHQGTHAEVWIAASGTNSFWGGCNVWLSVDNTNYAQIGVITNPARQGVLTANLKAYGGNNPDTLDTLSVDLAESLGTLTSGSAADAQMGNTLCYVDGELISFQTASLVSGNAYNLTSLYRGLYRTSSVAHKTGGLFARLDNAIFKYKLISAYVNQILYIKLQSFNIYGDGVQQLSACTVYQCIPAGIAMAHPAAQRIAATNNTDAGSLTPGITVVDDYGSLFSPITGGTSNYMPVSVDLGSFTNFSIQFTGANVRMQRGSNAGGNSNTATLAFWLKRSAGFIDRQVIWTSGGGSTTVPGTVVLQQSTVVGSTSCLQVMGLDVSGSTNYQFTNVTALTDSSIWHSVQLIFNGASTDPNTRLQLIVDQTTGAFSANLPASSGVNYGLNLGSQYIANSQGVIAGFLLKAKIAEFYYIDGQALTSTSFTASSIGPPLPFTGFTGMKDSYLNFTNSTNLGLDFSGENNSYSLPPVFPFSAVTSTQQSADHP